MKMKPLFFLPGAIALMLAASPMIPAFTNVAFAGPGRGGAGMKYDQLNLTDAQKAQMQQIKESTRQQMDAIFTAEQKEQMRLAKEQRQRPNLNLTEDQKTRLQAVRQSSKSQMEAVLTAEQKQQLEQLRQQWRQRRQQPQS
ncbi:MULTISPECIES: Spy/CpxP family protein refolding chaperone [unclassified Coleofasciculus]|uniref:Spy/CpxP family protein refolding chaperone n=2 Tax=Cyanobacteriota TaxID=1117 RepID=UPI001683D8E1|nr:MULTISPECIES: Spy/CpxP family protein refolding chaperone [unclassified Coleofasciculus]MBD1892214.1 Spy/CpxP family protein refolding chaperone [Coleofasciculus sp. FACHB-SPT9]MBD2540855.1 Spy/CpxP family protein refolding chaperone [Coleofasciculus sp. FACHB-SPT36]